MDIDFVVLWVDGNDPEWRAEKAKYQGAVTDDSNSVNRFRDWGLMPYWFRAVEKFTPWVLVSVHLGFRMSCCPARRLCARLLPFVSYPYSRESDPYIPAF